MQQGCTLQQVNRQAGRDRPGGYRDPGCISQKSRIDLSKAGGRANREDRVAISRDLEIVVRALQIDQVIAWSAVGGQQTFPPRSIV